MRRMFSYACAALLTGCTPASFASGIAAGPDASVTGRSVLVDVNLTNDPAGATPGGTGAGYAPVVATLAIGDAVRFRNTDGFAHTATSIAGAAFPVAYPFDGRALVASGAMLSGGFSSGSLAAGASSRALLADRVGTFLFGCYYHYGAPMRAAIVVR